MFSLKALKATTRYFLILRKNPSRKILVFALAIGFSYGMIVSLTNSEALAAEFPVNSPNSSGQSYIPASTHFQHVNLVQTTSTPPPPLPRINVPNTSESSYRLYEAYSKRMVEKENSKGTTFGIKNNILIAGLVGFVIGYYACSVITKRLSRYRAHYLF